ncbi:Spermidine/putrescine import ATP-binding protein PotA [Bienertia sinuspersici]
MSNGRGQTSTSRPSSPSPRIRSQQPVVPSDFPHDTPPNLRTTMPDRPASAGRSRPGALASKVNTETPSSLNMSRRPSSPIVSRGRSAEPNGRGHLHSNVHNGDISESRKSVYVPDSMRKPVKASTTVENGGMGRTISKKSIDMAIRHMDIRNGSGSMRPLPSTSLFPQSIRTAPSKTQATHGSGSPTLSSNGSPSLSSNGSILENGTYANGLLENGKKEENGRLFGRLTGADMYESTRYDAILLKEDLKNTTWLHSLDDMSDQCSIFENGFEHLPEPFGL